ncbi:universal stress protein [Cyclobacterium sp. 1_MG-2023]|uniref:universal stress protein n=1 Tax=Cyclobacterium sp. 1_MG-2023 TaxID=3062681 RepID=UPI0026E39834|nr:universal stress protein [Cyclobacterium sp. 1_MG-2023]MDO6438760.1 universal stress protein [Cyclobacterium sp. 1_MG-2023]
MKKILFATDFSENAEKSLDFALNLARNHGAELIMLHVFEVPTAWEYPYIEDPLDMEQQGIREAEKKLVALFESHTGSDEVLDVTYLTVENDSMTKGILEAIEKSSADLVVMGTKGGSKVKELLIGSTTKSLLSKSPVPILAVPENVLAFKLKKVLFASDFQKEDLKALQDLVQIISPFHPEIIVTHVSKYDEAESAEFFEYFKKQIHDLIDYPNISFQGLYSEKAEDRLVHFIDQNQIDLLVMLEKKENGLLEKLFHPDLVKKMEFRSHVPVLSLMKNNYSN